MIIKKTIQEVTSELNRIDDDLSFLRQAYQLILGRQANDGELQFLQYQLETGVTRKIVISNLLLSPEHAQLNKKNVELPWIEKKKLLVWKKWHTLLSKIKTIQTFSQATAVQNQSFDRLVFNYNKAIASLEKEVSGLKREISGLNRQIEEIKPNILFFLNQEAQAQQRRLDQFFFDVRQELRVSKDTAALDKIDVMSQYSIDTYYISLEQAYRGSRDEILHRYKATVDLVKPLFAQEKAMQAADLGCGRGEWLQIISGYCAKVTGIDMNSAMVSQCLSHGLNAEQGDLLEWLQRQPDQSLDLITAFHVIEHLPFEKFNMLIHEIYRVLTHGGSVILETPNPENIHVATHMFYRDPTHKTPVPKELSTHLLKFHGFKEIKVHPVHPFEDTMRVPEDSEVAKRFNSMVYGAADYMVTGTKQPAKK
ncbi:class I SAM-dependent methyltransferase [Desulfobacter postgatei]|uniref:class I SAM-dependent methyltransferase n=1 Tax=Desulfobacter postgatei TaxID=2293 RepID=UPI00259BB109|nr:class I SAM-dependent methyltransferase [uncultured Desulfobacter sp.]